MKKKRNILLLLIAILLGNCNTHKPILALNGKAVRGKVLDGETGEVVIGQNISEFDRNSNNTTTDTLGNFELIFLGNNPIVELTGFYEPLFVKVSPNSFNKIILNAEIIKNSKKIFRKISKFKKREKRK